MLHSAAMRFHQFDLNLLTALDTLLFERQVSRAAERLGLSQPAMSNALRRLREHFGDALLVQVGRQYVLTPIAEDLQPRVRSILAQLEPLIAATSARTTGAMRVFRVMASDYIGTILLPRVARRLIEARIGATLSIVPIGPAMEERLQLGEVDMLIAPERLLLSGEPCKKLFSDGFSCLAWSGNRAVQPTLTRAAFEAATHLIVVLGSGARPNQDTVQLAQAGLIRRSCVSVPHFLMVPEYLEGSDMIATVHTRLAHHLARSRDLVVLNPPAVLPRITEVLQWSRHREADRLHARVRRGDRANRRGAARPRLRRPGSA